MSAAHRSAPPARRIRIVLVDDHALVREGLRARLEVLPNLHVVGEAGSGAQALRLAAEQQPDLMLLDVGMRGMSGIQVVAELKRSCPSVRVLMLSMYDQREYVVSAMHAGASGYLLKEASITEVIKAIEVVADGETYFSHAIDTTPGGMRHESEAITSRERDVLIRLAQGQSNKAVARALEVSVRTVETHRLNLRRKLGIDSPAALLKYAVLRGWSSL